MPLRERLRVAFVSFDFGEYCVRLASSLAQHADVLLLMPNNLVEPHLAHLDKAVSLVSFPNARIRHAVRQFRNIRTIFRKIRDFAPDLIHYQGVHPWFDLAFPLLRRVPLVQTIHDFKPHTGDQPLQQTPFWIETIARRCADALIVHTQFARERVVEEFPEFAHKISIIPHIQIGEIHPSVEPEEDENLIFFFGRIWEYKGLEYLIRAEPLISSRVPQARILIAGQGEDFSRYARMMVHEDRFIIHNEFITEDRAAEYFRRASVVVLPYIEASQSGVIPMAYSAGKPVVATTVGGLPEMVENGRTGYLVAPRDETQLAEAVTKLLLHAPLRRQMGANGKRKIEEECSPAVIAQKTFDVYRRAVEKNAHVRRPIRTHNSSAAASRIANGR